MLILQLSGVIFFFGGGVYAPLLDIEKRSLCAIFIENILFGIFIEEIEKKTIIHPTPTPPSLCFGKYFLPPPPRLNFGIDATASAIQRKTTHLLMLKSLPCRLAQKVTTVPLHDNLSSAACQRSSIDDLSSAASFLQILIWVGHFRK